MVERKELTDQLLFKEVDLIYIKENNKKPRECNYKNETVTKYKEYLEEEYKFKLLTI